MSILKIKNAINHFNDNRDPGEVKMTQKSLGKQILADSPEATRTYYMSKWCNGEELTKLKPHHIVLICVSTGVDPNFLFDWVSLEQKTEVDE